MFSGMTRTALTSSRSRSVSTSVIERGSVTTSKNVEWVNAEMSARLSGVRSRSMVASRMCRMSQLSA